MPIPRVPNHPVQTTTIATRIIIATTTTTKATIKITVRTTTRTAAMQMLTCWIIETGQRSQSVVVAMLVWQLDLLLVITKRPTRVDQNETTIVTTVAVVAEITSPPRIDVVDDEALVPVRTPIASGEAVESDEANATGATMIASMKTRNNEKTMRTPTTEMILGQGLERVAIGVAVAVKAQIIPRTAENIVAAHAPDEANAERSDIIITIVRRVPAPIPRKGKVRPESGTSATIAGKIKTERKIETRRLTVSTLPELVRMEHSPLPMQTRNPEPTRTRVESEYRRKDTIVRAPNSDSIHSFIHSCKLPCASYTVLTCAALINCR